MTLYEILSLIIPAVTSIVVAVIGGLLLHRQVLMHSLLQKYMKDKE